MISLVHGIAEELRSMRIPVATSEIITAVQSLELIDMGNRTELREALAGCLIKKKEHRSSFDLLFDLYFSGRPGSHDRALEGLTDEELREALLGALATNDRHLLRQIASEAVDRHAKMQPGRRVAGTYYIFSTMSALGVDTLVDELTGTAPGTPTLDTTGSDAAISWFDSAHRHRTANEAVTQFERIVEGEVRSRLVAERGAGELAGMLRNPLPEDSDFLTASIDTVERMSQSVAPLARALARILLERDNAAAPRTIDLRTTMRKSLSTGGIPITLAFTPKPPPKPRLVVIADVSGSVASFAAFALQLAYALRSHFSRQRSFVFVDGTDEVTDLVTDVRSITATTKRINDERRGVWLDGHSDYGNAFETFVKHHLSSVDSRTTVLVLGDGRNNYRDARPEALATIRSRSGGLFWLNPERPSLWNDGDAVMHEYAPHCDRVVECRTIRQLEAFIESLG